jgi:hypothetical protein
MLVPLPAIFEAKHKVDSPTSHGGFFSYVIHKRNYSEKNTEGTALRIYCYIMCMI